MNRNSQAHFASVPRINHKRSRFDRSFRHGTTFDSANLVPVFCDDILPGDSVSLRMSSLVRMTTPLKPVMDNCVMDVYFHFVPLRLLWSHVEDFLTGGSKPDAWTQPPEYNKVPTIKIRTAKLGVGSMLDYLGIPPLIRSTDGSIEFSELPVRAVNLIWNQYFRDQNLMEEIRVDVNNDTGISLALSANQPYLAGDQIRAKDFDPVNYVTECEAGIYPPRVCKHHDYFTSMLPDPQKFYQAVSVGAEGFVPLAADSTLHQIVGTENNNFVKFGYTANPLLGGNLGVRSSDGAITNVGGQGITPSGNPLTYTSAGIQGESISIDINALRMAVKLQEFYEQLARGGSRYVEVLRSMFGVISPDARLQRAEYLGGARIPVNMSQILQTIDQSADSPLGDEGAYSLTQDSRVAFSHSFVEHGYLIGLVCIRPDHTYSQGIEKMHQRIYQHDFYYPAFDALGEQPVYASELYVDPDADAYDMRGRVLGFQEAWASYRYKPNMLSGFMRPQLGNQGLGYIWTYGDNYESEPFLSPEWMFEDPNLIGRTLASEAAHQFFGDFHFSYKHTRPMSVHSVPSLTRM